MRILAMLALSTKRHRMLALALLVHQRAATSWNFKSKLTKKAAPSRKLFLKHLAADQLSPRVLMLLSFSRACQSKRQSKLRTRTSLSIWNYLLWSCTAPCWQRTPFKRLLKTISKRKITPTQKSKYESSTKFDQDIKYKKSLADCDGCNNTHMKITLVIRRNSQSTI